VSEPDTQIGKQTCPSCHKPLADGSRFCPHCGTPLHDTSATRADSEPTCAAPRPKVRELELPVLIGNRYRLEELRGGGGMAKVYRAVDVTLEREVAVKLINAELRNETEFDTRFQREAKIASQLADPHIVVVHDYGLDSQHGPFLVMEYLQGQSLRERIAGSGPLPLKAGLQLAGQLLLALIHAHNKGIVHRDIKPDNIFLLNQSGVRLHTRVLDFGIARIYRRDEPSRSETITHAGAVLGTPRYMSPEQLAGQPVDVRSDLYSAALVIHEALTGQVPAYGGKKLVELCPDASPALQELLDQCLKPDPAERPPTAVEVYLRLQELGKASGILLLPPGAMDRLVAARKANEPTIAYQPAATSAGKRRLLIGLAVLVVVLGLLGLVLWLTGMFSGSARGEGPEQLFGIKVGDPEEAVERKLRLTRSNDGNPWTKPSLRPYLGNVLRPEDLRLSAEEFRELKARRTEGERATLVLFHKERVVAVVSDEPGAVTAQGVKLGGKIDRVYRAYQGGHSDDKTLSDGTHLDVRRYDHLGIGFEIKGDRVTSISIFPPVP
jgi:tRNA A-37 threonylcarbamoyl transferase component Bud32